MLPEEKRLYAGNFGSQQLILRVAGREAAGCA